MNVFPKPIYCCYCAQSFLNAASLITYRIDDGEEIRFHDRGYQAVAKMAGILLTAEAEGKTFRVNLNHQSSAELFFATVFINGTGVCLSHVYSATDPINQPPLARRSR